MASDLTNDAIADRLLAFAGLLELAESNPYAARAYRRAAEMIRSTPTSVAALVREGRARDLRGIGASIESKLRELVETGDIAELHELETELQPELIGLGRLLGLSTRRILDIGSVLGVRTAEDLRAAAAEGRLGSVPGIGPSTEARINAALAERPAPRQGLTLNRAQALTEAVAGGLGGYAAGDARRCCELSFDLAVVSATEDAEPVLRRFAELPLIVAVVERAERRAVGVTVEGVPITVTVAEPHLLGTALVRATGSAAYAEALEPLPEGATEEEVFAGLGIPWRPPELREVDAPECFENLLELRDIRGDLHCHTAWSDGRASVMEMGAAAIERGYEYLAICDHTVSVRVVPGLDEDDLRRQSEEIAAANEQLAPFRVLRGVECDILPDGTLDIRDEVLAELDWVQISLHAGQRRTRDELTRTVCEAMRNPHACALSHPKGRILNRRPENALDLDAVFEVALETGLAVEINGLPDRLDLSSRHAREALVAGIDIVVASDAHSTGSLASLENAVATARRAGASRHQIRNTRPLDELRRPSLA